VPIRSKSLHLLQRITAAANEAETPEAALQICLDEVCQFMGWPIGHVYMLSEDRDSDELVSAGLWHLDDPKAAEVFRAVTEATHFVRGSGLPGRVLQSGKPAWITDVVVDPNFPRAKLSKDLGVHAGFAFPVMTGSDVVGVLEFFAPDVVEPDQDALDLMADVGTVLGRAVERDRARKALQYRERYIQAVLDNLVDGVLTIDEDGNIEEFNPAAEAIFGYKASEIVGQSLVALMPQDHADRWAGRMPDYLRRGRERFDGQSASEVTARRKNGSLFPLELTVSEFAAGGRNLFIGVVRDLTQRKEQELQLQQAQRLEAVGQLTGGIAHDFNNGLTVLLGNLQIVEGMLESHPEALKRVRSALNAGRRAAETTRRLLTFARRQPMRQEGFNANVMILETVRLIRQTLSEAIEIDMNLAGEPMSVRSDKGQFENALINLAVNARDAMPEGGHITIATRRLSMKEGEMAELPAGNYVGISLKDTGCGMPEAVRDKVFEPFFTTKDVDKGTGLGLSMVFGYARQSGGDIRIESREGEGTTVEILLPFDATAEETEAVWAKETSLPGGTETILVVEDDADVRSFASSVLSQLGYTVLEAANGTAALEILETGKNIDLVFSDIVMPGGIMGQTLGDRVHIGYPGVRVLLTTGYAQELAEGGRDVTSATDLLIKPYGRKTLAQAVRTALDANSGGVA